MNISDTVALVTGANRGIGRTFVEQLAAAGAKRVYAAARDTASLEPLLRDLPRTVVPLRLDVTDNASIDAAAGIASDVNLLVNNAGVVSALGPVTALADLDGARREMETNYFGLLEMTRAFAPILAKNEPSALINVLSITSIISFPRIATYSASKSAALAATRAIRAELKPKNVRVIAVMPGFVDTDMARTVEQPKVATADVVRAALRAIEDGTEDVYPGEQAQTLLGAFFNDHKALERELAGT
ncbi:MAG: SDR family oxidoreductase [Candidatus Eremiobacteraeota bacterium]|nr:SDR family oxidoreductase [Candidatus Eremiobacteraeota bacterium]